VTELQKIPMNTLLKAQKKLARQSAASTSKSNPHDTVPSTSSAKVRSGRRTPRRSLEPHLLLEKPASETERKKKVKAHRDHKHA
jgi:hypothetical protein